MQPHPRAACPPPRALGRRRRDRSRQPHPRVRSAPSTAARTSMAHPRPSRATRVHRVPTTGRSRHHALPTTTARRPRPRTTSCFHELTRSDRARSTAAVTGARCRAYPAAMHRKVLVLIAGVATALAGLAGIPPLEGASAATLQPGVHASSVAPARPSVAAAPAVTASAVPGMAIGAFDRVTARFGNPEGATPAYAQHTLYGWAADPDAPGQKIGVDIYLNGVSFFPAATGYACPTFSARSRGRDRTPDGRPRFRASASTRRRSSVPTRSTVRSVGRTHPSVASTC